MNQMRLSVMIGSLLVAMSLTMPVAAADRHDYATILKAVDSGDILPLKTVLRQVEGSAPGVVIDAELERKGSAWFYEIDVLQAGAVKLKLKVDARDGRVVERR